MRVASLVTLLLFATSISAQQSPIIKMDAPPPAPIPMFREELNFWKAIATHDLTSLHTMLLPSFLFVGAKTQDREQALANIGTCQPARFGYFGARSYMATPDVVIITYHASQDIACSSGHKPGDVNVSSTWVKRDGQWFLLLHTETPITDP